MKIFRTIPSLAVASLLVWGPISLMSGCGDSAPSGDAAKIQPMPATEQDSIKKAMEANKKANPTKGKAAGSR